MGKHFELSSSFVDPQVLRPLLVVGSPRSAFEKHHVVSFGGRRRGWRRRRGTARRRDYSERQQRWGSASSSSRGIAGSIIVVDDDDENTFCRRHRRDGRAGIWRDGGVEQSRWDARKLGEFGVSLVSIGVQKTSLFESFRRRYRWSSNLCARLAHDRRKVKRRHKRRRSDESGHSERFPECRSVS